MTLPKKFQTKSEYDKYDIDGDGVVTDEELAQAEEIMKAEAEIRKLKAQRRMATYTLIAMGAFTLAMFFVDIDRVRALGDISNLVYLSGAGIVGAYMGMSAWMSKK